MTCCSAPFCNPCKGQGWGGGGSVVRMAGRRAGVLNPELESLAILKMFPLAVKALHEVKVGLS